MNNDFYKLMLVTHRQNTPLSDYLDFIEQCVSSGVSCVQLREKNSSAEFKLAFAKGLKKILMPYHIPLIINDDLELAMHIDADGVHLGQSDTSPEIARKQLGPNKIIGLSIEAKKELERANMQELNYVAASAVFPSQHKNNLRTIWGIEGLRELCQETRHPMIGIGGIEKHNLSQVIEAGAQGIAVIGALHQASNPAEMALALRTIIDHRTN